MKVDTKEMKAPGLDKEQLEAQIKLMGDPRVANVVVDVLGIAIGSEERAKEHEPKINRSAEVVLSLLRSLKEENDIAPLTLVELSCVLFVFIEQVLASSRGMFGLSVLYSTLAHNLTLRHDRQVKRWLEIAMGIHKNG